MEALHHTTYFHHPLSIRKPMFYSNKPVLFLELNLISSLVPNFFWHVSRCHSSLCKNAPSQYRHQQCLKREAGNHLRRPRPLSFVCQKNVSESLSLGFRVQNLDTTFNQAHLTNFCPAHIEISCPEFVLSIVLSFSANLLCHYPILC